ncbi:hypothetical protein P691DRAFT_722057 [Macrolepiota fuliginosa MF-IS2]|uniref:F-box domain-containing protein n=1 Tax=Macrolepiota fuliginosa MF-IS2 TaxID=1400762 RepID=A0A9P5XJ37_9AGAR|nr:hypothetical protein P691DRAFT_722057 [Macrolepiota fuliginosa MF-IS2]
MTLFDLPPELLTRVLLYLPFTSVPNCQRVNRYLHVLISESAKLQYHIHLGISGLMDNPHCSLPVSERLGRLRARERRWEELNFDFDKIIDVPVVALWKRRRLSGGVLSLVYADGALYETQLPGEAGKEVKWKETFPKQTQIDAARRVYEHDLYVLVIVRPRIVHTNVARPRVIHEVQVHLNQLSTGGPHPNAQHIISFETHEEFGRPWSATECVGDHLVLVLRDRAEGYKPDDQVYVYEWKTGRLKMRLRAPFGSYSFPLFLTAHMFLLPNSTTGELEYWQIPQNLSEATFHQPHFILSLPRLGSDKVFGCIWCRAEPNPTNGPRDISKPFYADSHSAIVIFNIVIQSPSTPQDTTDFTFFVHRSSLVGYLDRFSAFISSDGRPSPVPYDSWGPSACRWFSHNSINGYQMGAISAVFGELSQGNEEHGANVPDISFNPPEVGVEPLPSPRVRPKAIIKSLDPLNDPDCCFEGIVYSSLPYTVHSSQDKYDFFELVLDEEDILGIPRVRT